MIILVTHCLVLISGANRPASAAPHSRILRENQVHQISSESDDPTSETDLEGILRLAAQTDWVAPESTFRLALTIDGAIEPDTQLALRFYNRVSGRIRFSQSIEGSGLGTPIQPLLAPLPLETIPRDPSGRLIVDVPVSATSTPENGIRLTSPGVYPVSVAITDVAGREIDSFITHLIRLPDTEAPGPTLAVSLVVPIHASPTHQPDGTVVFPDGDLSRIDNIVQAIGAYPSLPMTVVPTPETIDALNTLGSSSDADSNRFASLTSALKSAVAGREVLTAPYVRLDMGSWLHSDMVQGITAQLDQGASTVSGILGSPLSDQTWIVDRTVTPEVLDLLVSRGVEQLVISSDLLADPPTQWSDVSFTNTFDVATANDDLMRAAVADTELSERLTSTSDPVLNAHLALADLAVLYFDRPSRPRGIALALPTDTTIPQATLDTLFNALNGNRSDPDTASRKIIGAVSVDDLFRVTDPAGENGVASGNEQVLVREYEAEAPLELSALKSGLITANQQLDGFRSMVGEAPAALAPLENQILIAGARGLTLSQSEAFLDGVVNRITEIAGGVAAPPKQVVTLTARSAKIPLAIDNHLEYPVRVRVHLDSDKLIFPDSDVIDVTLPAAGTTRLEIAVEARASGAFPVEVSVTSPDDSLSLGSARLTVRSTAISGLGLALSIGAGLFLAAWWLRNYRTTRRARRLVSSTHPSLSAVSTDNDRVISALTEISYDPAERH